MRSIVVALLATSVLLGSTDASAAFAPLQRGAIIGPPAENARAVVTLCGLAVFMVEDSAGRSASLYAGSAIDERIDDAVAEYQEYELADIYTPIAAACESIRAEHERILRGRAASSPAD